MQIRCLVTNVQSYFWFKTVTALVGIAVGIWARPSVCRCLWQQRGHVVSGAEWIRVRDSDRHADTSSDNRGERSDSRYRSGNDR